MNFFCTGVDCRQHSYLYSMANPSTQTFQVYSASAGAGKTFSLVREYLVLCLKSDDPNVFTQILAITFTVKAADEMKKRVISSLDAFRRAEVPEAQRGMFHAVRDQLGIDDATLRNRSNRVLRRMLHDYTGLSISTIDKFTYRVVSTFGHDLGLGGSVEIDLDVKELYRQSVDLLLDETGINSELTHFLQRYVEDHMEDGKSWKPSQKMVQMANHIGKEDSFEVLDRLGKLSLADYKDIREALHKRKRVLAAKPKALGEEGTRIIGGVEASNFSGKYVVSFAAALGARDESRWSPNKTLRAQVEAGSFVTKTAKPEVRNLVEPITPALVEWLQRCIDFADRELPEYIMIRKVLDNFDATAVLHEIGRTLDEFKKANNVETLSTFNKLIHESLKELPVAYIYERIGEKYRHYFIDEFQDTSVIQWQNLTPLVHNAISSGGTTMIVGDAKQSIYRWRGGRADQFLELIDSAENPGEKGGDVAYALDHINLKSNWRSGSEVVKFNNRFFEFTSDIFTHQHYKNLYGNADQKPEGYEGGYVAVDFLEYDRNNTEEYYNSMIDRSMKAVEGSIADGYRPGDIAVLVRNKKGGNIMATELAKRGYEVVSADSLSLVNSLAVRATVCCMRFMHYPDQLDNRVELVDFLHQLNLVKGEMRGLHETYTMAVDTKTDSFSVWLKSIGFNWQEISAKASGLYEIGEAVMRGLGLFDEVDPFVQFFLDQLWEYGQTKGQNIHDFLEWWEERKDSLNISAPESNEAIRVMTIHKAKGLEFPVVVFPYADFEANISKQSTRWIHFDESRLYGLPVAEMGLSKSMNDKVGSAYPEYGEAFEQAKMELEFDNLNLLYVAFTRPVERLYVVTRVEKETEEYSRVSEYISKFVRSTGKAIEGEGTIVFGAKHSPKYLEEVEKESIDPEVNPVGLDRFFSQEWRERVKLSRDTDGITDELSDMPRKWGNTVHAILAQVEVVSDIETVVSKFVQNGQLPREHSDSIRQLMVEIVNHPQLYNSFTADEVWNERDWLGAGSVVRPDRISRKGDEWFVIDYKTGEAKKSHQTQITQYAQLLGDVKVTALLVYINQKIEVVTVDPQQPPISVVQTSLFD